jgi:hypothetical protein
VAHTVRLRGGLHHKTHMLGLYCKAWMLVEAWICVLDMTTVLVLTLIVACLRGTIENLACGSRVEYRL